MKFRGRRAVIETMPKPKKEYRSTKITVEGRGQFPVDMLRYDNCVPNTSADATKITDSLNEYSRDPYQVTLRRFSDEARPATEGRWKSFGFNVVGDEGVR